MFNEHHTYPVSPPEHQIAPTADSEEQTWERRHWRQEWTGTEFIGRKNKKKAEDQEDWLKTGHRAPAVALPSWNDPWKADTTSGQVQKQHGLLGKKGQAFL